MTARHTISMPDAGQRARAMRRARVNTAFVRVMRWVLPVCALALLSSYGIFVQRTIKVENETFAGKIDTGRVVPSLDNLAMANPSFEGFSKKDGSRYRVKAQRAITDLSPDKPIKLVGIDGEFEQANGNRTIVKASEGVFDRARNQLVLAGGIEVQDGSGLAVRLKSATIETDTSTIISSEPVDVSMPAGELRGQRMLLRQRQKELTFSDGVAARFKPPARASRQANGSGADASPLAFAGDSDAPVEVKSKMLLVEDGKQTARFSGAVRAVQTTRSLEAPALEIVYDGQRPDGAGQVAGAGGNGQIRTINATGGVRLQDGDTTVVSQTAVFDVKGQTAALDGGVNITSGNNQQAESERADADLGRDRFVLSGRVRVRQGENVMRGNRLVWSQKAGSLELTAPEMQGSPGGEIFVRFVPPQRPHTQAKAPSGPARATGFQADPNAPVEIRARALDVEDRKRVATFAGNVLAKQGDIVIETPQLVAVYSGNLGLFEGGRAGSGRRSGNVKLSEIRATNPVSVVSGPDSSARGESAVFDVAGNKVTMTGNVILRQGRQIVRGDTLEIDLTTGVSRMRQRVAKQGAEAAGSGEAGSTRRAMQHGRPPEITANPGRRDCQGQMCAVFYPNDVRKQRAAQPPKKQQPAGEGDASSSWSATTRTN